MAVDQAAFDATIDARYFEDYVPGSTYVYGETSADEAEIVEFAKRYDPQSFHTDPVAAEDGPFGGLIASGWHTAALMMRLLADHYISRNASLGSPGVDELRWLKPVRPGQVYRLRVTVLDAKPSRSKPDRGVVRTLAELIDVDDEPVFRTTALNLLSRRPV